MSLQDLVVAVIEKTPVLTTVQEARASVASITTVKQVLRVVAHLHYLLVALQIEEFGLVATYCCDHTSAVVAKLSSENKGTCVLSG